MKSNRGKVLILIFVFGILYAIVYYRFLWVNKFSPEFERLSLEINSKKAIKNELDQDLANIETLKREVQIKTVRDERLNEFLMAEANISDSIEYVDKLDKMFGNSLKDVNINPPVKRESSESKTAFYEFKIDFSADLTFGEILNLIDFLEGGSRKIRVPSFDIKPMREILTVAAEDDEDDVEKKNPLAEMYTITLSVNLHALDEGNINTIYEFSKKRFNRFDEGGGFAFTLEPKFPAGPTLALGDERDRRTGGGSENATPAFHKDITITLKSFYAGGPNVTIRDRETGKMLGEKMQGLMELDLVFDAIAYNATSTTAFRQTSYQGNVYNDVINIEINADFPTDVPENENLRANVKITNNSGKQIRVKNNDKVRRVHLIDRNGNHIYRNSEAENLIVI